MHFPRPSFTWASRLLDQWQPSGSYVLGAAAVVVGLLTAGGIWLFKELIHVIHDLGFGSAGRLFGESSGWVVLLVPVLGGILVGLIMRFLVGAERRHGVAGIMEAVAVAGGRLRYRRIPPKSLASALSIGTGASVGPEDPSVQIGAGLGSAFGQWFRLSDKRVRSLVAAGAAAGIAAAFNAPIAAVFFSLEIILGQIGGSAVGVVLISAVVSAVFTQAVSGAQPAFHVPPYTFHSVWELPLYVALGLLAGPVAAAYSRLLEVIHDLFARLSVPRVIKPAIAGLLVGLVALGLPQVLGVGYETIELVLAGGVLPVHIFLLILIAKMILTPVSLGAGFQGGVFAPSLFLGAVLGGAFGIVAATLFPELGIAPAAFGMVGMAAVLAGAVHAPMTAVLLLFEMTNDYRIILPLMLAVAVSLYVSQKLQKESIYTRGLARRGIRIEQGRDIELMEGISVREAMSVGTPTLQESDTIDEAAERMGRLRTHGMPVVDASGRLVGVLTLQDIDRAGSEQRGTALVGDLCTRELLTATPGESLATAMRRMSVRDVGRMPVVDENDHTRLVGLLRRSDLIRAYDMAVTRRATQHHRRQQARLEALPGIGVVEVTIESGSPAADRLVRDVPWPADCVVASLRRGARTIIPKGETQLRGGDVLAVVADPESVSRLEELCKRGESR